MNTNELASQPRKSKAAVGRANREGTMLLLARLGYASTRQVARAIWSGCSPSNRKMAERTLRSLRDDGYILSRREDGGIHGEQLSALNRKGTEHLSGIAVALPGGKAHARAWMRRAHSHRTACNSVFAALYSRAESPAVNLWSELEVCASLAPLNKFKFRQECVEQTKIPDLISKHSDGLEWIEVENTYRGNTDFKKLVAFMRALFHPDASTRVVRVHFVIAANGANSIGARLRKAMTHDAHSAWPRQVKERDADILARRIRVSMLDAESLTLTPVVW